MTLDRSSLRTYRGLLALAAFLFAALLSWAMALAVASALEGRSERHVLRALSASNLTWAAADADGLQVTLTGTAPTEAMRFRAAAIAARVVGARRIIDEMDVVPAKALTAPEFSLELLRNDDGISAIGLVPTSWDAHEFQLEAQRLADGALTNMLETSDYPMPERWEAAVEFGLVALRLLPRSKISIRADGIEVNAISDSPAHKRRFEAELARAYPQGVPVKVDVSAPRPVITPYTFRFVKEASGIGFDACAADSERARARILAAARAAGVTGTPACTLGLGSPSPRWADAVVAVTDAMAALNGGTVTISDVDVTFLADATVSQEDFDRVLGELTAKLPDVFSLKATLSPKPEEDTAQGPTQFTASLSPAGEVQLRGLLADERMRDAVEAYARARFGASQVEVLTRLEAKVPFGWATRVLAGLSAMGELTSGSVIVRPDTLVLRGVTGNQGARSEITRLLSERLGQGAGYSVEITYNERLDPSRGLPSPKECHLRASAVLQERNIAFAPNSTEVSDEAAKIIEALAASLKDCHGVRIEVGGHTDAQGRAETNMRLSQQRAEAVLEALGQQGFNTSTLTARGYGASEPVAENSTEAGREANRRIALKLLSDEFAQGALPPSQTVTPEDLHAHSSDPAAPETGSPPPQGAGAIPIPTPSTEEGLGTPDLSPEVLDWQDSPDPKTLRPQPRPEDLKQ